MPPLGLSRFRLAAVAVLAAVGGGSLSAGATPPGQNGLIIWERGAPGASHLWIANPDGSGARQVFRSRNGWEMDPAFSPADPNVVFFTWASRRSWDELYRGNLTTGVVTRVTRRFPQEFAAAVSPDGTKIAYTELPRRRAAPLRIRVTNIDGSGDRALTPRHRRSYLPDWSPDGNRIVYTEIRPATRRSGRRESLRLMVMNADGTGARALTSFGGPQEVYGRWMPDGQTIIFERIQYGPTRSDVVALNASGGAAQAILASRAWEMSPVPSPDGTRIVFASDRHRTNHRGGFGRAERAAEIYTMAIDGSDISRLTNNRVPDRLPEWQLLP
jgi:Tol biopolymer transport system component